MPVLIYNYSRPWLVLLLASCCQLALAIPATAADEEIRALRIGLTPGRVRVVFDLSDSTFARLETRDAPERVAVIFASANSEFNHQALPLGGTPIARITRSTGPDGDLQYVFELKEEARVRMFSMGPNETRGHRLVLDLYEPEPEKPPAAPATATAAAAPAPRKPAPATTPTISEPRPAPAAVEAAGERSTGEWSGFVSLDARLFFRDPAYPEQDDHSFSTALQPEYYLDWDKGSQRFAFSPFFRYDANDDERTHADLRELYWRIERDRIVGKVGVDVVFWGVAESQHLVDIINQTDLVENIDGEDKLGQPMLNLDYMSDWGTWQLYVLPWFRERTFPGENGRLRTQPFVDTDDPLYESSDEEKHTDFALRWSHYVGDWDIGIAHFSGTSRQPLLVPAPSGDPDRLLPLYLQIDQTSLDAQITSGAWLWKLEAIYNSNKVEDYYAWVGGFEHTTFGVAGSAADLGLLLEYHYDEWGERSISGLENDIYLGMRLAANDMASSSLLFGVIVDVDTQAVIGNLEASRRLGESWVLTLESRFFSNLDKEDDRFLYSFRKDNYLEIQFTRFF